MQRFAPLKPLNLEHQVDGFDCGSSEQTLWLIKYARPAQSAGSARVHVVQRLTDDRVVGYVALAAASINPDDAPARLQRGIGRHPIPMILLARLGVDVSEQRRGLGSGILRDTFRLFLTVAEIVGARGLLIHCENEQALAWYLSRAAFEASPTDPLHLILLAKDLRRALLD